MERAERFTAWHWQDHEATFPRRVAKQTALKISSPMIVPIAKSSSVEPQRTQENEFWSFCSVVSVPSVAQFFCTRL